MKIILSLLLLLSLSNITFAQNTANECIHIQEDVPVLAGGRIKPVFVLAKESVKFLTGKSKFEGKAPLITFCEMLFNDKYKVTEKLPVLVEHVDTKKLLKMDEDTKFMLAKDLIPQKELVRAEILKLKENTPYKKDLNKVFTRIDTLERILDRKTKMIYTSASDKWVELNTLSGFTEETASQIFQASKSDFDQNKGDDYLLELTYVKSHIYGWALLICLIAIVFTVIRKDFKIGVSISIFVLLMETVGMTWRVLISGRAPITNMYETVLFSGYGALLIALVILYFKRDKIFLLAGLGYNVLCLMMMMFANNMLSSSISPLVPVLRDNFWLSTHVTTIILSYAALALSWMVANITIFKMLRSQLTKKDYAYYQNLIYTCIKVGIILLAAGIILGGIWADYSWGRFWGWDPKETWSLIVLLFYMVMVHGRYTNWMTPHRFVLMAGAGFMTVMMAWFGVNYILASGLHSYGFSEGGAVFLGSFFAVQTVILIIAYKQREKAPV